MSDYPSLGNDSAAARLARRVDRVCDRFEAAWQAGRRPRLERYLGKLPPPVQSELLRELLVLELEYRYQSDEKPEPEEYRLRFPQHAELIGTAFSEAEQPAPSTPYLLPKWTVSRLVSQLRMLAFPEEDGKVVPPDLFSVLAPLLCPTPAEHGGDPEAAALVSRGSECPTQPFMPRTGQVAGTVQGQAPPSSETPAVRVLGDYELLDQLGKGGMGVVYRARQRSANRIVALKVIRSDRLEQLPAEERQEWFERFRREFQIAARLDHDYVVAVYDVDEGQHFYSMHFVDGQNLAEILRKGPVPNHRAAVYLERVAQALHALHLRGIVHRDLKPRNILVDASDRPFVTDFGLAKCSEYPRDLTHLGAFLGTPEYMAPEQARNPAGVQAAADVYSLGATLYALLTGRPPFQAADPVETLRQVRDEEPLSPRRLNPAVHRDLELICLKCLEKEPHKRYASAEQVAEELRRYRNGEPLRHTRAVGRAEHLWRWCRRKPFQAAVAALAPVALMAMTAFAISVVFVVQLRTAVDDAETYRHRADTLLALEVGRTLCEQGEVARGMFRWASILKDAPEKNADFQRAIRANLAAWGRQISPLKAFLPHQDEVVAATFSPDGKTALTVSGNSGQKRGEVHLWDATTGEPIGKPIQHHDVVKAVVFSPDGRSILTASKDHTARRWDAATGEPLGEPYLHEGDVMAVAFSLDGKTLLTASQRQPGKVEIRLWDAATGKYRTCALTHEGLSAVLFSPQGKTVLTRSATTARLWDLDTGNPIGEPLNHPATISATAFSPDGKTVVTGSVDGTARLWDAATGKELRRLEGDQGNIFGVAFSPDGKMVLTGSDDGTARLWDAATGREQHRFKGHQVHTEMEASLPWPKRCTVNAGAFSHDGKTIVTAGSDRTVRLWDTATGNQLGAPLPHADVVRVLALSPDGKSILTRSSDKQTRLWAAAPASRLAPALSHSSAVHIAVFSPDGRTVLTGSYDNRDESSGEACLWNVATKKLHGPSLLHNGWILTAAFSPNGKTVLTGSSDNNARLWDIKTGQVRLLAHADFVHAVAFSPDGKTVATGSTEKAAQLWDIVTEQVRLLQHPDAVYAVTFSRDGQTVLTGGRDAKARLWHAATGVELRQFNGHSGPIFAVAFSPDDQTVLTGSADMTARLWNAATAIPRGLLRHDGPVRRVVFNQSDGTTLLTGSEDGTARLWDAATATPLGDPMQYQGMMHAVALSPDGKTVLTGSPDNTARFWDAATGQQIGPSLLHPDKVWTVAFSPDGKTVVTGSEDKSARLWEVPNPVEGEAERIVLWTQVITGMKLEPNGALGHLNVEEWSQCRRQLEEPGGPPLP